MVTTKAQFVKWLEQFPDDATIECIVAVDAPGSFGTKVDDRNFKIEYPSCDAIAWFGETFEIEKFDETIIRIGRYIA